MIGRFTMHAFLKEKYNERENSMQHDPDQVIDHDECTGPTLALSLRRISILGLYLGFALCLLGLCSTGSTATGYSPLKPSIG